MFDLKTIEWFGTLETPFYYYDMQLLKKTLDIYTKELKKYDYLAHYAFKANANDKILELIKSYGLGADCVSGNEVSLALKSGFDANKVVYAGVGKSDKEIVTALEGDIFSFNCESIPEIEVINEIAARMGKIASVSLRINPEVDAHTHKYITTGTSQNKFGISYWMFDQVIETLKKCNNVNFAGLHFHVGSQITDYSVFEMLAIKVNEIVATFKDKGMYVHNINLGGGLGIDYSDPVANPIPDFVSYFSIINKNLNREPGQVIHFEPGRAIVGQCGSLISRVLYVKIGKGRKFAILDAGMNDLIRPALYEASHKVQNLTSNGNPMSYDVVGPICESSDSFGENVLLPLTERGNIMAIRSAGAYGQVMAMRYNQKDLAPEYYSE
ncbi:MAG: diaminopimelate decarboxylase [Bacteroidales bacterium]